MRIPFIVAGVLTLGLSACGDLPPPPEPPPPVDPITKALSGKTLVNGQDVFELGEDGSLTGVATPDRLEFVGTWQIVNGEWCRALIKPDAFLGRECQAITLGDDDTVTITGQSGPRVWSIK